MLTELRPKKDLLDSNFSGYKLSLDSIPAYHQSIIEGVDHVTQNEDQYSFIHTKVFSLHNHLFSNPWLNNVVYFVNKNWDVCKASISLETGRLEELVRVWTIPDQILRKAGHFNVSLLFPTAEIAVLSDGCGQLYILSCSGNSPWQVQLHFKGVDSDRSSLLMSARVAPDSALHCVLMTLETTTEPILDVGSTRSDKSRPTITKTILHWLTFIKDSDGPWNVSCKRQLEGAGFVDYVTLEVSCSALYIGSNGNFKFTEDSANPLPPQKGEIDNAEQKLIYTWEQTLDDLKVMIEVSPTVQRDHLEVEVKERELTVRCQRKTVLTGPLSQAVDTDLTTWTLQPGRLDIILSKQEPGPLWPELVIGDKRGHQVIDPALADEVHARLSHLCTDSEVQETGEGCAPTFNLDQLEECDSAPEDSCSLTRLDCTTHTVSHQIALAGHQWLMSVTVDPSCAPCMCVRHDVDGCVWQIDPPLTTPADTTVWPCQHIGTFCALGYVAASKQQKKFILAAPDLSYAVICEVSSHVFVYRKASVVNGELRNRRTSAKVPTVAKQQLINLESQSAILGAHATSTYLFVLTTDNLFAFQIQ